MSQENITDVINKRFGKSRSTTAPTAGTPKTKYGCTDWRSKSKSTMRKIEHSQRGFYRG